MSHSSMNLEPPSIVDEVLIDPGVFRSVLGSYPTGVCAITSQSASSRPVGMVVGSFTSVSLYPPLVGFFPDKGSTSWPQIEETGVFCANVLASHQGEICRRLAAKGEQKFAEVGYDLSEHGLPLVDGALAHIECRIHSVTDAGDHWFVLGRVVALRSATDGNAMLFFRGAYGGFSEIFEDPNAAA